MAQVPRRGSRPTRFTWTCRRWPRRRSRLRRKRSPLQHRPARQHRRRWPRQQQRQRRRPHQRLRLLLPRHPHPQRRRHHPRPTIPGRHDNFGWRLKPKNQPSKNGFGEPRAQSGSARDGELTSKAKFWKPVQKLLSTAPRGKSSEHRPPAPPKGITRKRAQVSDLGLDRGRLCPLLPHGYVLG